MIYSAPFFYIYTMKRLWKNILKGLENFGFLITALILLGIAIPISILYHTYTSIRDSFRKTCSNWTFLHNLHKYLVALTIELSYVAYGFFYVLALTIDYLGNVLVGPLICYYFCNDKEWFIRNKTALFAGKGRITISSAVGELQAKGKLNAKGVKFCKVLNRVFRELEHCLDSYKREVVRQKNLNNAKR